MDTSLWQTKFYSKRRLVSSRTLAVTGSHSVVEMFIFHASGSNDWGHGFVKFKIYFTTVELQGTKNDQSSCPVSLVSTDHWLCGLLWTGTRIPSEDPPVQHGDHKPSYMFILGTVTALHYSCCKIHCQFTICFGLYPGRCCQEDAHVTGDFVFSLSEVEVLVEDANSNMLVNTSVYEERMNMRVTGDSDVVICPW